MIELENGPGRKKWYGFYMMSFRKESDMFHKMVMKGRFLYIIWTCRWWYSDVNSLLFSCHWMSKTQEWVNSLSCMTFLYNWHKNPIFPNRTGTSQIIYICMLPITTFLSAQLLSYWLQLPFSSQCQYLLNTTFTPVVIFDLVRSMVLFSTANWIIISHRAQEDCSRNIEATY